MRWGAAAAAVAALAVTAGCGSSSSGGASGHAGQAPKGPKMLTEVGAGEGKLNLIAWAGYAEDGSTDPKVDWVHPFEKKTGCNGTVKIGNTRSEERRAG